MLLKFKNKHILALEKLIADAEKVGGITAHIILDPKEAYGLISEIVDLGKKYTADVCITDDGVDITREKLLMSGLRLDNNEGIKDIVNRWYKTHYKVEYKGIPLKVVKPEGWLNSKKENDVPDVPTPNGPLGDKPDLNVKAPEFDTTTESFPPKVTKVTIPDPPKPPPARSVTGRELDVPKPSWFGSVATSAPPPPPPPPARSVTGRELDVPKPPKGPPNRLLTEDGIVGQCYKCGSSLKSKWMLFKAGGCIQPECEDYWKTYNNQRP